VKGKEGEEKEEHEEVHGKHACLLAQSARTGLLGCGLSGVCPTEGR